VTLLSRGRHFRVLATNAIKIYQGRGCDALDPIRCSNCARTKLGQFFSFLSRQPRQIHVVQLIRTGKSHITASEYRCDKVESKQTRAYLHRPSRLPGIHVPCQAIPGFRAVAIGPFLQLADPSTRGIYTPYRKFHWQNIGSRVKTRKHNKNTKTEPQNEHL
jgi:hypothetical protein